MNFSIKADLTSNRFKLRLHVCQSSARRCSRGFSLKTDFRQIWLGHDDSTYTSDVPNLIDIRVLADLHKVPNDNSIFILPVLRIGDSEKESPSRLTGRRTVKVEEKKIRISALSARPSILTKSAFAGYSIGTGPLKRTSSINRISSMTSSCGVGHAFRYCQPQSFWVSRVYIRLKLMMPPRQNRGPQAHS